MLGQLLTLIDLYILANYPVSHKVVKVLQARLRDIFGTCLNMKTNDRIRKTIKKTLCSGCMYHGLIWRLCMQFEAVGRRLPAGPRGVALVGSRPYIPSTNPQWLKWSCEAGGSPDEARLEQTPHPTNLALFGHKITLYRFNRGSSYYCRGLKSEQGAEPHLAPSL